MTLRQYEHVTRPMVAGVVWCTMPSVTATGVPPRTRQISRHSGVIKKRASKCLTFVRRQSQYRALSGRDGSVYGLMRMARLLL